jgi:alcohol dehydrogenase class IV
MVSYFTFSRLPEIHFGIGKLEIIPKKIKQFGNKVLLVTGKSSFIKSKKGEWLINKLGSENITVEIVQVAAEPSVSFIDEVCKFHRKQNFNAILAIGGGSVIDAGKAISAMLAIDSPIKGFLEGLPANKPHPGSKVPFIAVPTTAGTGSETTKNAVISEVGENGFKKSLRHENFIPEIVIVDPELTLQCPPEITAASGLDAFTQLLEAYTSTQASPMTDALAFNGLQYIANSLLKSCKQGDNIEARCDMSYAAMLSGIALANAGLGAVHGFASSIAGYFDVPHGIICGTLLGAVTRKNIDKLLDGNGNNELIEKYINVGRLFLKEPEKHETHLLNSFANAIDNLIDELQMPKLGKFEIKEKNIDKIVSGTAIKNNAVQLNRGELIEILKQRV